MHRFRRQTRVLAHCGCVLAALALLAPASQARQSARTGADEAPDQARLEQVIVTAQKRAETLQSVPLGITSIDQRQLEVMGIDSVAALARQSPGLTVVSSGPGQNILIVRGIASSAGTAGTVGYYVDDTPISASSNASLLSVRGLMDPTVFDIARAELLRGPQGTLYGSSSMGGTVKYITRQPDLHSRGGSSNATLSATDGGNWNRAANGMLNIPLRADRAALRLSVSLVNNDGYIDSYPIDPNNDLAALPGAPKRAGVNTERSAALRALLKVLLDDGFWFTTSLYHQQLNVGAPFQFDSPPGSLDKPIQTRLVPESTRQNSTLANLAIHKNWDGLELIASSSYFERTVDIAEDASKPIYSFYASTWQTAVYPSVMTGRYINREYTEELRLISELKGPLQAIGGMFFHYVNAPLASSIPIPPGYNERFGTKLNSFFNGARQATVNELAWFSELSYQLTPSVSARAGLRAFRINQSFAQQGDGELNGGPSAVTGNSSDRGVTPKLTLSWQPDQNLMLYTTAAQGYRAGGPNNPAPASVCGGDVAKLGMSDSALQRFEPDSLWNYELGAKSILLDGRMTLNASLYLIEWSKVQQQIVLPCGFNITSNFGSATSKGAEVELNYQPTRALTLRAFASVTDATLNNDVPGTAAKKGDRLLDVPHASGGVSAQLSAPLGERWAGYARIDYSYTGGANTLYDRASPFHQRLGYGIANLRLGADQNRAGPRLGAALFIDNVFNKIGQTGLPVAITADLPDTRRIAIVRPRTVGVTLSYLF